jgi:tetratricopeptide (TPR) repeat protein
VSSENETNFAQSLNGKLHRLFLLLIIAFVVLSSFRPPMDNVDIGWHVAQGRWMVEHGAIYRHDVFNYPNMGHEAIDEYPIFQVVLYFAWNLGWWGPCLFTALTYVLLFGLLIRAARSFHLSDSSLFALSLGLLLPFLQVGVLLRPHMATYLGLAVLGIFLLRHREATSWTTFWPIALLQIAWVNSHSGFILEPALIGLFGAEITARHWLEEKRFPWTTIRTWAGALLLVLFACLINPYGLARLYLPFYQEGLESIRAYVGEMEPLIGGSAVLYGYLALIAAGVVAMTMLLRRGAVSYSFLFLAFLFYIEALSAKKYWPIFGLFVPLLILSSGAFSISSSPTPRKLPAWLGIAIHSLVLISAAMAIMIRLDNRSSVSLQVLWRDYEQGRSELALKATEWMKTHGVKGRLFHRCEDGGLLQQSGYDHGETFADTGFGKYDPAFIHEAGQVGERPALLPRYLDAYQPAYVVCGDFCYQWPYYLRQKGWRLIFYSPNSSVWTQAGTRTDLSTVPDTDVMRIFDDDIVSHGRPGDLLYGRNLITLNSMGLEDFVFAQLKSLPDNLHYASWYWEAARILCFDHPSFSIHHRNELLDEAKHLHDDPLTAEFRAYCHNAEGDTDGSLHILENIPPKQLGNYTAELLLKIYLNRGRPEALALARRTDCFDLRNGRHWQYLAEVEERAGHRENAARAWEKAVFYYPDDATLMEQASAFAVRSDDKELSQTIAESSKVYGEPKPALF